MTKQLIDLKEKKHRKKIFANDFNAEILHYTQHSQSN